MKLRSRTVGAVALLMVACGAPGLKPAGPAPGEVDTGYGGTQPREKTTGAVTSVSDKETARTSSSPLRLEDLLRGKSSGVQIVTLPDGRQALRIRGTANIQSAQMEPLIVVDGIQIGPNGLETALAGLTPDDIKQVDVLKDVASTSIYGQRGASGVIVISTKRR